jgi:hypothetical protein
VPELRRKPEQFELTTVARLPEVVVTPTRPETVSDDELQNPQSNQTPDRGRYEKLNCFENLSSATLARKRIEMVFNLGDPDTFP